MSWEDAVARANAAFVDPVVGFPTAAMFTPALTNIPVAITGVIVRAPLEEEYAPGSIPGSSVVRLWVDPSQITPGPQKGDLIEINGASYDIFGVEADPDGGGSVLKLRRNS